MTRSRSGAANWRAAATHRAGTRPLESREHVEQRRFAAAGGPEQTENLAVCDIEIDAIEGDIRARAPPGKLSEPCRAATPCPPVERKTLTSR